MIGHKFTYKSPITGGLTEGIISYYPPEEYIQKYLVSKESDKKFKLAKPMVMSSKGIPYPYDEIILGEMLEPNTKPYACLGLPNNY